MLQITDSGANIYLIKQATTKMAPVIMPNEITVRLPDDIKMESSHIARLHLPGLSKQSKQIHILPKMKIDPLISLGFLCDYGCTILLEKKDISAQKNGQEIIKGT